MEDEKRQEVDNGVPSNRELREVVRGLQNGRTVGRGASRLQAEHIKVWLSDVVRKEQGTGPMEDDPQRGKERVMRVWEKMVHLH